MRITRIVGAVTREERTSVVRIVKQFARGGPSSEGGVPQLPTRRIEVHVTAEADASRHAAFIFENGTVTFRPEGAEFETIEMSLTDDLTTARVH